MVNLDVKRGKEEFFCLVFLEAERDFSALKLLKTRLRNRLSQLNLQNLLMIYLSVQEISDFDFAAAVKIFLDMRESRRLRSK